MSDPVTNNAFASQIKDQPAAGTSLNQEFVSGSGQRHLKQEDGLFQAEDEGTKSNAPIVEDQREPNKKGMGMPPAA